MHAYAIIISSALSVSLTFFSRVGETLFLTVPREMGEARDNDAYEEELLDYEEDEEKILDSAASKGAGEVTKK